MKKEDFNTRLKPFDDLYSSMHKGIRKQLEAMTQGEIDQIVIDTRAASMTNCAWSTYAVASIVREIAQWVTDVEELRNAPDSTEPPSVVDTAAEGELN